MKEIKEDVCGLCARELSAFGSKPFAQGVLCRDCVSKLSEWITDEQLSGMTLAGLRSHLAYRNKNAVRIAALAPTASVGGRYSLNICRRQFFFSRREDYIKENADVFRLGNFKSVRTFTEKTENSEGSDVFFRVELKRGELPLVQFRVNDFPGLSEDSEEYAKAMETAAQYARALRAAGVSERKFL